MRSDGRLANGLRPVKIKTNYIKHAEGSCLFEIGSTRVVCTASIEDGVPRFLKGRGTGWITSEYGMLPRSCKTRVQRESSSGKKGGRTHEVQRLVGRSMRSVIDLAAIGERTIWIDCDVIEADGGTRCASITGGFVALSLALNHLKKKGLVKELPISHVLAAVSVGVVDGKTYLDLNYEEDSRADVDANIVMTESGKFSEIQGTAEVDLFSRDQWNEMMDMAGKGIKRLIEHQKEALKGVLK